MVHNWPQRLIRPDVADGSRGEILAASSCFPLWSPTTDITEARQGAANCSVAGVMAILLAVVTLTNLAYQVIHKPTKLCL